MNKRKLGKSGIEVSGMGMGCWAIGGPFWRNGTASGWGDVDDERSIRSIHRAIDLGITFFDTADVYGAGHSERVLGKALSGKRSSLVVATKFGNVFDEATREITGSNASPEYIRKACDASLSRLGTDYIDLYQFHLGGHDLKDAATVRDTLEQLVEAGKIRAYAWSTDDPERAKLFAEGEHCASVQHQMNVFDDAAEMVSVCEALNLASINRGPLAMGLLSGKYTANSTLPDNDVRGAKSPEWMKYFRQGKPQPEFLDRLEKIRKLLTADGRTLVQGALGWLWGRSEKTVPIPGFKTVEQVEENCGALAFGPLAPASMREIDRLLERA